MSSPSENAQWGKMQKAPRKLETALATEAESRCRSLSWQLYRTQSTAISCFLCISLCTWTWSLGSEWKLALERIMREEQKKAGRQLRVWPPQLCTTSFPSMVLSLSFQCWSWATHLRPQGSPASYDHCYPTCPVPWFCRCTFPSRVNLLERLSRFIWHKRNCISRI